jgi:hypothetical protein
MYLLMKFLKVGLMIKGNFSEFTTKMFLFLGAIVLLGFSEGAKGLDALDLSDPRAISREVELSLADTIGSYGLNPQDFGLLSGEILLASLLPGGIPRFEVQRIQRWNHHWTDGHGRTHRAFGQLFIRDNRVEIHTHSIKLQPTPWTVYDSRFDLRGRYQRTLVRNGQHWYNMGGDQTRCAQDYLGPVYVNELRRYLPKNGHLRSPGLIKIRPCGKDKTFHLFLTGLVFDPQYPGQKIDALELRSREGIEFRFPVEQIQEIIGHQQEILFMAE